MTTPLAQHYQGNEAADYDRRRYRGWARQKNLRSLERALERALAEVPSGALLLDLPCGTGILRRFLLERGYRLVSSDVSPDMLALAAAQPPGLGQIRADYSHAPFRPDSFDAVLCIRFLMLLRPDQRADAMRRLAELSRGPLIFTVTHPYTIKSALRRVRKWLGLYKEKTARLSRADLEQLVAAAGLKIERVHTVAPLLSEVWIVVCSRPR